MKLVISALPKIHLRQMFIAFLLGVTFFIGHAFSYSSQLQAQAKSITPEAKSYQVEQDYTGKEAVDTGKNKLEEVVDNVVQKLNLNEPLPESTKEFLEQTQEKVSDVVEPVTGNRASDR